MHIDINQNLSISIAGESALKLQDSRLTYNENKKHIAKIDLISLR